MLQTPLAHSLSVKQKSPAGRPAQVPDPSELHNELQQAGLNAPSVQAAKAPEDNGFVPVGAQQEPEMVHCPEQQFAAHASPPFVPVGMQQIP
jgi:hypothetical protein